MLFDAVTLLPSEAGVEDLLEEAAPRDFVADAFQHCKFIGHTDVAMPLLEKAGIAEVDEGEYSGALPKREFDKVCRRAWQDSRPGT